MYIINVQLLSVQLSEFSPCMDAGNHAQVTISGISRHQASLLPLCRVSPLPRKGHCSDRCHHRLVVWH